IFIRIDALLGIAGIIAAGALSWSIERRRPRPGFVATIVLVGAAGYVYLIGPMRSYITLPQIYLGHLPLAVVVPSAMTAVIGLIAVTWLARRRQDRTRAVFGAALAIVIVAIAVYAYFFREPGGKLTEYDAHALRDFVNFYLG